MYLNFEFKLLTREKKREKEGEIFDHIEKTMKVTNSTSYSLSMDFIFLFAAHADGSADLLNLTAVLDKKVVSNDFHLGTFEFLVLSLSTLNKSEKTYYYA